MQISHAKLAMRALWGHADSLVRILDAARASGVDITADIYPYLYWHSTLTVLFPKRDFENRTSAEFALTETSTPGGLLLGRYEPNPAYAGKTVAEIAKLRGTDSITTLIDLIRESEAMREKTGRFDAERHRHEHGGAGRRAHPALAAHEPEHRRLARRPAPARLRRLPALPRRLRPRAQGDVARGGRAPHDVARGGAHGDQAIAGA